VKVALIHTGRQQGVALKVQHLPISVRRHAHLADQHVRKTPYNEFSHAAPFRHGWSCIFAAEKVAISPSRQPTTYSVRNESLCMLSMSIASPHFPTGCPQTHDISGSTLADLLILKYRRYHRLIDLPYNLSFDAAVAHRS
jgi:hypothetical protein